MINTETMSQMKSFVPNIWLVLNACRRKKGLGDARIAVTTNLNNALNSHNQTQESIDCKRQNKNICTWFLFN